MQVSHFLITSKCVHCTNTATPTTHQRLRGPFNSSTRAVGLSRYPHCSNCRTYSFKNPADSSQPKTQRHTRSSSQADSNHRALRLCFPAGSSSASLCTSTSTRAAAATAAFQVWSMSSNTRKCKSCTQVQFCGSSPYARPTAANTASNPRKHAAKKQQPPPLLHSIKHSVICSSPSSCALNAAMLCICMCMQARFRSPALEEAAPLLIR